MGMTVFVMFIVAKNVGDKKIFIRDCPMPCNVTNKILKKLKSHPDSSKQTPFELC